MILVVMGVSGCGKSSVGRAVASALDWTFIEGDHLHPPANLEKMAAGIPLDDEDRWPWLDRIAAEAGRIDAVGGSVVVACSALKRCYRERLGRAAANVRFAHLKGDPALIQERMRQRPDHFMPPALLASQLATLEAPAPDEQVIACDIAQSVLEIASMIVEEMRRLKA